MENNVKFAKFLELAKLLNDKLSIVPMLYGSLGLEVVTGDRFNADDVDILVPKQFIFDGWNTFAELLESNGYKFVDLHEHTFVKYGYEFSFACVENWEDYFQLSVKDTTIVTAQECQYRLLTLEQYLAVYEKFAYDEYRITKGKSTRDLYKVEYLKERLKQGPQ